MGPALKILEAGGNLVARAGPALHNLTVTAANTGHMIERAYNSNAYRAITANASNAGSEIVEILNSFIGSAHAADMTILQQLVGDYNSAKKISHPVTPSYNSITLPNGEKYEYDRNSPDATLLALEKYTEIVKKNVLDTGDKNPETSIPVGHGLGSKISLTNTNLITSSQLQAAHNKEAPTGLENEQEAKTTPIIKVSP